jgi:uncharacterized repeat protein (TIGR03803 family)
VTTISNVISGADGGGPDDSESPGKGLTLNSYDGYMYGTTATGGSDGNGTIYKLNTAMYGWSITNGTITGPTNTPSIQWMASGTNAVTICVIASNSTVCVATNCTTVTTYTGAIAAGGNHSLAVLTNHTLWVWGRDDQGQLGDDGTMEETTPEPIEGPQCGLATLTNVLAIAAGYDFSVAVDATGAVWTWGDGGNGQLGNGGNANLSIPAPISFSNVISVAAGYAHTLALRADGTVWAWGYDLDSNLGGISSGVLGAGSLPESVYSTNVPIQTLVPSGIVIVAIAASDYWNLALDTTGRIWGWGDNESGQIGTWGGVITNIPVLVPGISNVIAIAVGDQHAIAVTADKTLWTWGQNASYELGRSITNADGYDPMPTQVPGISNAAAVSNVVAVAGGFEFTMAVTSNGQLVAFGINNQSQLGTNNGGSNITNALPVAGITNVVLASANPNGYHSLALAVHQGTNQYYGWGENNNGQVGSGTNGTPVDAPAGPLQFCSDIQLGTGGVFTATCTGTLVLFFNDNVFYDNLGSYTATVYGVASNVVVDATNNLGVAIGTVSNGVMYSYSASGLCTWATTCNSSPTNPDCTTDANGNHTNGVPADCVAASWTPQACSAPCPALQCFSLVGKIVE